MEYPYIHDRRAAAAQAAGSARTALDRPHHRPAHIGIKHYIILSLPPNKENHNMCCGIISILCFTNDD